MKDFNLKMTRALQLKKRVKRKKDKQSSLFKWWLLIVIVLLGVLLWPVVQRLGEGDAKERLRYVSHGSSITKALLFFAGEHDGKYPCEATGPAASVEQCFQQLIDGGYVENETVFWSEPGINDGLLKPGECSWGYVKGLSSSSSSRSPLLFSRSKTAGLFNTEIWDGYAIVAKIDGSLIAHAIAHEEGATEGVVLVDRDGRKVDVFANLPEGAEIMVPTPFTAK